MAKFLLRAGTHLEPDPTDTTFKAENRTQRERMYIAGDIFESKKDRVKQFGEKFMRMSDNTKVTQRPIYKSGHDESDFDALPEEVETATATIPVLTEDQLNKMAFADLAAHCKAADIDTKGVTDRKKVIQLILDDQSA